jgi:uncharacterized protein (DUF1015 family)
MAPPMPEVRAGLRGEQPPVDLRPFRGIAYDPTHVDDLFALLAPPYDVISQQEREIYYRQHPHNVVRLIYGRDEAGDTADDNRYTRAANYLQGWLRQGVLRRDSAPSMYLCAEQYLLPDGTQRERQGLIALCRLEPYERGIVLPHEETSPVPKRMLFDLRSAVEANLSQIFALYADDTGKLQEILAAQRRQPTRLSFRDRDHMLRRVWAISEPSTLTEIRRVMSDNWALIADGHHRYETCLAYQQMRRQRTPHTSGEEWFNFAMLYLTDIHDPGLTILPTHRALRGLPPALVRQIPTRLRDGCAVEAFPFHTAAERDAQRRRLVHEMRHRGAQAHVFGLYTGENTLWLLTYRGAPPATAPPTVAGGEDRSALDVSLLHDVLLGEMLGIDAREDMIAYTQDDAEALGLVSRQEYQLAFLLNPTRVEQVVQQATAGRRMPRKSTYFYPKLLTGIVIHQEVSDADHVS